MNRAEIQDLTQRINDSDPSVDRLLDAIFVAIGRRWHQGMPELGEAQAREILGLHNRTFWCDRHGGIISAVETRKVGNAILCADCASAPSAPPLPPGLKSSPVKFDPYSFVSDADLTSMQMIPGTLASDLRNKLIKVMRFWSNPQINAHQSVMLTLHEVAHIRMLLERPAPGPHDTQDRRSANAKRSLSDALGTDEVRNHDR